MDTTPKRLGKYELVERLGHGGMAEVWKALDTQLQRYVAIKVLQPNLRDDPNFANRFQREARLIASLHHPNIVQVHDFQIFQPEGDDRNTQSPIAYMVMNYVEGQTLADYLRQTSSRGQTPSPEEIVNLFTSISQAVDYAHQQGMIHRDIKPANILLDQRNTTHNTMGEPILTDFGVAKLLSTTATSISGAQLGTPLYISPEQARGYQGDERSDLYSLGVILYEIVTGVTPFRGNTPLDVVTQHVHAAPTAPSLINPRVSPPLALVIMRCLAKDPASRFDSASSLTAALADALKIPRPEILGLPSSLSNDEDMPTPTAPWSQRSHTDIQNAETIFTPIKGHTPTNGPVSTSHANLTPVLPHPTPTPSITPGPPTNIAPPIAPLLQAPQPPSAKKTRRNTLLMILLPLFIVILLVGALGSYVILNKHTTPVVTSSIVGHAYYVSSGQVASGTAKGIADRMQITLQNIPDPHPGKSYYVWLLPDINPNAVKDLTGPRPIKPPLLLTNNLPVHNKQVNFTYGGDSHNNNLISTTSRILITEEDANQTPAAPSADRSTWRYYGEIPQGQIPGDGPGFSALIHIRHLFYNETNIDVLGLPGGLDNWMLKNTEKVFEWSISARDYWSGAATTPTQLNQMWQQFIRILDYLDGTTNVHVDMPTGTPVLVNRTMGRVALLTVDPQHQIPSDYNIDPPGYLDHVELHVGQIAKATDISPAMLQSTARILDDVNRADAWLKQVHEDARTLFLAGRNLNQLKQPAMGEMLDQMVTYATYAYIGKLDPITNTVQGGVIQAHYEIQQLATLNITRDLPQHL
jgi:eukaryotic-like serine/threonine-protein kinase